MKWSIICISNSFNIVVHVKTVVLLADVLFLMLGEAYIDAFIIFVNSDANIFSKIDGAGLFTGGTAPLHP